jgi:hypothetical protein
MLEIESRATMLAPTQEQALSKYNTSGTYKDKVTYVAPQ